MEGGVMDFTLDTEACARCGREPKAACWMFCMSCLEQSHKKERAESRRRQREERQVIGSLKDGKPIVDIEDEQRGGMSRCVRALEDRQQ